MRTTARYKYIFILILVFTIVATGSSRELLNDISDNYLNSIPFALGFRVQNINEEGEASSETKGQFIINENNEFRVDYPAEDILYDGKWLWTYNKTNQQTIVEEFNPSSTLSLIYDIINGNLNNFSIEDTKKKEQNWTLNLEPKNKNNFFQKIKLTAKEGENIVEKAEYVDYRGSRILVDFISHSDTTIQDSTFYDVKEYKKEELIDLRP